MRFKPSGNSMLEAIRNIRKKGCSVCGLQPGFCVCKELPAIATRTRLSVVIHRTEICRPSNSGQLAAACLKNSDLFLNGRRNLPVDWSLVPREGYETVVLYPEGSLTLNAEMAARRPLQLIVPDGNWRQASRMFRRLVVDHQVPGVRLPSAGPSGYQLRRRSEHHESQSTFEAVIRALAILEGAGAAVPLQAVFDRFVSRHLVSRGKIHPREVF